MQSRQSKKSPIVLGAALTAIAAVLACAASAQPLPERTILQPGPLNRPDIPIRSGPITPPRLSAEEAEEFRQSMAAYEQCKRQRATQVRLVEATDNLIGVRDKRAFWESAFKNNATLRSQNSQGYEQLLGRAFEEYRSLGGTAASANVVIPMASPCQNPWEFHRGPKVPLIDSRTIPVAPK